MTYGKRLKKIRKILGLTQEKIAMEIGLKNKQTISDVENGKQKRLMSENEVKLSQKYHIDIMWLVTGDGSMFDEGSSNVRDVDIVYHSSGDRVSIPYHPEVYASAGGGSGASSMVDTFPMSFSKSFLHHYLGIYNFSGLSIINAAGDSMSPTIKSGELMFVYPVENDGFVDGGIYVILCGSDLYVKRVWRDPNTREYTLSSDNERVSDILLTIEEGSDCRFVGRVVGHMDRV